MSELIYVVKTIVFAFIFVLLLQIKVGDVTLENRFNFWVKTSSLSQNIQASASGAAMLIETQYYKIKNSFETWQINANK